MSQPPDQHGQQPAPPDLLAETVARFQHEPLRARGEVETETGAVEVLLEARVTTDGQPLLAAVAGEFYAGEPHRAVSNTIAFDQVGVLDETFAVLAEEYGLELVGDGPGVE